MKDNPRELAKVRIAMKRLDYILKPKMVTYFHKGKDKIAIPCYDKTFLKYDIIFSVLFISLTLMHFYISGFSWKSVSLFSLLSAICVPLYFFTIDIIVECYITNFFDKNDFLLVKKYCPDHIDLWKEAVVDAEYHGSKNAKEYAIEIINLAELRKNKAEKNNQDNLKNKWSENAEFVKNKYAVERELP